MIKIQFLTMVGCHNCEAAKKMFDEILPDFSGKVEVEEIDMLTPKGQELVQKYSVLASPGIIIDGKLFSTGGVDKKKLIEKLESLSR